MGIMIGERGRTRKFGGEIYYHWGNADMWEQARDAAEMLRDVGNSVKITGDRADGADIWVRMRKDSHYKRKKDKYGWDTNPRTRRKNWYEPK